MNSSGLKCECDKIFRVYRQSAQSNSYIAVKGKFYKLMNAYIVPL